MIRAPINRKQRYAFRFVFSPIGVALRGSNAIKAG